MKLSHPIHIDLFEFFKTGAFDFLTLGQTMAWVQENFPDPDDVSVPSKNPFQIWAYGDIELHFEDNELILIFSDSLSDLDGGPSLSLKRWMFDDYEQLNLAHVQSILNDAKIDYEKKTTPHSIILRLASGVELTFGNAEQSDDISPNAFMISAFSLMHEKFRCSD